MDKQTIPSARHAALEAKTAPSLTPGLVLAAVGTAGAMVAHHALPTLGTLTWAVLLGAVAANTRLLPAQCRPGLRFVTRRLLRLGVVLLGFSLSVVAISALGLPVIALVVLSTQVGHEVGW